jgi:hypothetical protein
MSAQIINLADQRERREAQELRRMRRLTQIKYNYYFAFISVEEALDTLVDCGLTYEQAYEWLFDEPFETEAGT